MKSTGFRKSIYLFLTIFGVISTSFAFAVWQHGDNSERVSFQLLNQNGERTTQTDLGDKHLMVFFGFTNCQGICPVQMSKMTQVMSDLDNSGHGKRITPVFISVDPERDDPPRVARYLKHFDERFVGLTGSRTALKNAADAFNTLLEKQRDTVDDNYQVTHSSVIYVVDPFGRMVDFIPGSDDQQAVTSRIRAIL